MTTSLSDETRGEKPCGTLDPRDVRALTQEMTIMEHVGQARGADGMFLVSSASGGEYLVDVFDDANRCTCPDFERNLPTDDGRRTCKHAAAVLYTIGARPIPGWVACDAICDQLLAAEHVDGEPRFTDDLEHERETGDDGTEAGEPAVATDGGRDRPAGCACADLEQHGLPCWACYRAGFRTPTRGGDR